MTQKANLNDMKKTMSEVAQALEQRTSFHDVRRLLEGKPDQSELTHLLQQRVSFDEMKSYVQQATAGSYTPQQENMDEEMRRLSRKVDETVRDLEGKLDQRAVVSNSVGASELTRLE